MIWLWILLGVGAAILLLAIHDIFQKKHAITRNFPVVGHMRYIMESVGPGLRQYIVADNDEELPFSRDQRRWVYASSKKENNYFGFGTDNNLEIHPNYIVVKNSVFPVADDPPDDNWSIPCAKVLGEHRDRKHKFRPSSVINISGMSWGSLSANAVEAINRGCAIAGCLHNTGEGGVAEYHKKGGELIWQLGTGYFGARGSDGRFSKERFLEQVSGAPIRAIEIKLSQGAKPGLGGLLPAAKITKEVARTRGIPMGQDCASPARHSAFGNVDEMLDFVEDLAESSGLPVGIKAAVGDISFWETLAKEMESGSRGVDFIAIDGGEGGTGAAPLAFSDHVALPFKMGMSRVYRVFAERGLQHKVVWVGAGKLGFPVDSLMGFGLGCDLIHVAREAMLAIGCIQAQECHTGHCPAGVATQSKWLMRGLDPTLKAARLANYVVALRKEILKLTHACGFVHPAQITSDQIELIDGQFGARELRDVFGYQVGWELPAQGDIEAVVQMMK